MMMLTKADAKRLPALYAQDGKGKDAVVYVKWFCITADMRWYATEYDGVDTFFGLVQNGDITELGYWTLSELASVRAYGGRIPAIERDMYFEPTTLGELGLAS
jgi:hypothetical protein